MLRKALLAIIGLALALPALAGHGTKEVPITKEGTVEVNLSVDKINLRSVELNYGGKMGGPLKESKGDVKCMLDNNGDTDVEVGVAVVLMDAAGNIVGATTCGTKVGYLKKGDRDSSSAGFGFVYRGIHNAKKMVVTLETMPKAP